MLPGKNLAVMMWNFYMAQWVRLSCIGGLLLGGCGSFESSHAEVSLPSLFSTHAVLQKSDRVPIWGKGAPGEAVNVTLDAATATAQTGADGRWKTVLDLSRSGSGPFELVVKGNNTLTVSDVMVGEVWLASGQSNMEWVIYNSTGAKEVIAQSANNAIRQFRVKQVATATQAADVIGEWKVADPATTGSFTAVGYFFAKDLQRTLNCPVGLINSSWGGTPIEAWTSLEALSRDADLKATTLRQHTDKNSFPEKLKEYASKFQAWSQQYQRADAATADVKAITAPELPATLTWKPVELPADSSANLPPAGAVWLRRTFTIPAEAANIQQTLSIGRIDGFYTVYFNGEKSAEINATTGASKPGPIYLNPKLVKAGEAVVAIRIYNPAGTPSIRSGQPLRFMNQELTGTWQSYTELSLPAPEPAALAAMPSPPEQPPQDRLINTYLYNGMIAPLMPYAIRGAIWYQGESNGGRGWQYRTAFALLIEDWRGRWEQGAFPFYFCQLANFGQKNAKPEEHAWAELRESQALALKLRATGQAILIDVGEADDVHWRNKIVGGERLSRIALANTYGKPMEFSGPVYESKKVEQDKIRLTFTHVEGGLKAAPLPSTYQPRSTIDRTVPLVRNSPNSELEGFAICGSDKKWVWAQARIDGNTVIVWSPEIKEPTEVRYAWAMNPTCNLTNGSGLPASPFRTDDFPLTTRNAK